MNDIITETKDSEQKKLLSPIDMAYIGMFTALITVCSWISIPTTIPFTLQTFAVFLTVALIGTKRSFISVIIYILLGAVGLPVFSGFKGGVGALLGPTGGYIIGFLFTALITGLILDKIGKKIWIEAVAMILGLIVCYAFGTAWFITVYNKGNEAIGLMTALSWCVIPYLIPDGVKIALAILIEKRIGKYVR